MPRASMDLFMLFLASLSGCSCLSLLLVYDGGSYVLAAKRAVNAVPIKVEGLMGM